MEASEKAQGRTEILLLSDSKSVPVANLNTEAQISSIVSRSLQDDSGHFVQGCVSLLIFRDP